MNDFTTHTNGVMSMCAIKSNLTNAAGALRIEPVDNWHKSWDEVRKFVQSNGGARKLLVDRDGWLSTRQVLMVAFVGKTPAAYLSFIVSPSKDGCVEARHISHAIADKFAGRGIESQLYHAALERTRALGCQTLRGFKLNSRWC
jgi:hypothetical protein